VVTSGQGLEIQVELILILDARYLRAEQIALTGVWSSQSFTSDGTHLQPDNALRRIQREIQPVVASAKSFVDDC
jgi:hypothetical protein